MKFYPVAFISGIDKTEGMAGKAVHVAVTVRCAAIAHQEHDLGAGFRG